MVARDGPRLLYRGEEISADELHVAIPRIGASITGYGISVVNQLDQMGVPVLAAATPITRSRDKLRALQLLSRFGIDIPRTVMCRFRDEVPDAVAMVGGLPCIIKLIQGTQGMGVMMAATMDEVQGMLDTLWTLGQEILLQELVAESRGRDVRALVVGDRVVAAMRRTAREGEFRSNIHRGGSAEAVELSREYAETAVKATRVVGLEVAGVDILEARHRTEDHGDRTARRASRGWRPPPGGTSRCPISSMRWNLVMPATSDTEAATFHDLSWSPRRQPGSECSVSSRLSCSFCPAQPSAGRSTGGLARFERFGVRAGSTEFVSA